MLSNTELGPVVAYLKQIIRPKNGNPILHQAEISQHVAYEDFSSFAADFWEQAAYPKAQSNKYETYSWSPSYYEDSFWKPKSKPDALRRHGTWRVGESAHDSVTVAYFDLDNQHDSRTMFTIDAIESVMKTIGVSYLLYTSYSHKPDRHKVRIISPINRDATWEEMFYIYAVMNSILDYQLDGSIYDRGDHLYGPTFTGDRRECLTGKSFDVDAMLAEVLNLPEEAMQFAQRAKDTKAPRRDLTPEEVIHFKAQLADDSVHVDTDITNPTMFNPEWLALVDQCYQGGSHRQTLLGIMSKVWLKNKGKLSFGEMRTFQREIDKRWNSYCEFHYGRGSLESDLRSVMALTVQQSPQDERKKELERAMKRLSRRRKVAD